MKDCFKEEIIFKFLNENINILVALSGFPFENYLKKNIYCLIHYNIPDDIETYLQDIGGINSEAISIGFFF